MADDTTNTNPEEAVHFEASNGVGMITLNRPDALNTINADLSRGLMEGLRRIRDDESIRVGLVTGAGRAFCAGADLRSRAGGPAASSGPAELFPTDPPEGFATFDAKKPLIAAVNGHCLGGGFEIALACDMRIASTQATFGLPEISLGFMPLAGAPQRLPRAIPQAAAMEMLFSGDRIDAATALQYGLVSRVVAPEELMAEARRLAERVASHAPLAVRALKEVVYASQDMSLPQALRFGGAMRWVIGQTDDSKEGPRAFAEKRPPEFKGR
jgi:enoyl-CoA hydratase/carnithine racemase